MLLFCAVIQLLGVPEDFRCVLEEDGSEILPEILEAIFEANEKLGLVMILTDGQQWSKGEQKFA